MIFVDSKSDARFAEFLSKGFLALRGNEPFQWQSRLAEEFLAGGAPVACNIPTGLGKTAVIPIWLIALAFEARAGAVRLPRRMVYVVDRRTVVDQATDICSDIRQRLVAGFAPNVAEGLRTLTANPKKLLSISTLRGELADDGEWREDPARAAIIVGTVDMIGSRLLFSGYGVSRRMRPMHAGLLGQDTLIVHDEAHLSPAFGSLIKEIERIQRENAGNPRPVRVMELSATRRTGSSADSLVFELNDEERSDPIVNERLTARKSLRINGDGPVDEDGLEDWLVGMALGREGERARARDRIVVYVRSPEMAKRVADRLAKEIGDRERKRVAVLTGTIRGHERDRLVNESDVFRGFRADPARERPEATEYLVATSAGEVGIDLDADHMVSDLTTLDSMIQRLGRVNRLGKGDAKIDVVEVRRETKKGREDSPDDEAARIGATKAALLSLTFGEDGRHDASPAALEVMMNRLGADGIAVCFSKAPRMVELTDILLDAWAMTSIDKLPGRPLVDRWLRGITSEPPSVYIAWRAETDEVATADPADLKTLFDAYPIRARERLRAPLREDTLAELKKIAKRLDERKVLILEPRHEVRAVSLAEAIAEKEDLAEATIVLPLGAGGLDAHGMLDGGELRPVDDVADIEAQASLRDGEVADDRPKRVRVLLERDAESDVWSARVVDRDGATLPGVESATTYRAAIARARKELPIEKPVELARIVLDKNDEGGETKALLLYARSGTIEAVEGSQDAMGKVLLCDHDRDVAAEAERIAESILSGDGEAGLAKAVITAAARHDDGKDREGWQKAIGNPRPRGDRGEWQPLAKSDQKGFDDSACGKYRHEFGSLRQATNDEAIKDDLERDLILHLIAAHHGWARPHFRPEHEDIGGTAYGENEAVAAETLRRFARLQRRFGHWGLAFLETLLRAADHRVSAGIAKATETPEGET